MEWTVFKEKIIKELSSYIINFVYLALFFCIFSIYRALLMAEYNLSFADYGVNIIKALVLAKLIMIGDLLHLGKRLKNFPLCKVAVYKTIVFSIWVFIFRVFESFARSFFHGNGIFEELKNALEKNPYEMAAQVLMVFFAFLPFFAFRELGNILGKEKLLKIFFNR